MATFIQARSAGDKGTIYTVNIDRDGWGGGSGDLSLGGEGFVLRYEVEDEDPASSIMGSSLEFSLIARTTAEKLLLSQFISALENADEGDFRVTINKDRGAFDLYWTGYVLTDQIAYLDTSWADTIHEFRIRAVDGISRLKEIDYNNAGTAYSGRVSAQEHLFNCVLKIGTDDLYDSAEPFLYVVNRWYEDTMSSPALTDNPLELTYIDHQAFIRQNEDGDNEYFSTYEVLEYLCRLFFARFYISDGRYRYDQISEYIESSVTLHAYGKDQVKDSNNSVDYSVDEDTDDVLRLARGRYSYFAPARSAKLTWKHVNDRNYLAGAEWSPTSTAAITTASFGRSGISARIRGNLRGRVDFNPANDFEPAFRPCFMVFYFKIRATSAGTNYYLKRTFEFNSSGVVRYSTPEWTTTATDFYYIVANRQEYDNYDTYTDVNFLTPAMPGSGDLVSLNVDFEYDRTVDLNVTIIPDSTDWEIDGVSLVLESDDDSALTRETDYELTNDNVPNSSLALSYEQVIGDNSSFFTSASLTIDDGTSTETPSGEWTKGLTGTARLIQYVFLHEVMKLRTKPLLKWEGNIYGADYDAHRTVVFTTNKRFAPVNLQYNSAREEWNGVWYFVGYPDTEAGTPEAIRHDRIPPAQPPGNGEPENPGPVQDPVIRNGPGGTTPGHAAGETNEDYEDGEEVCSITIQPIGTDGLILAGDEISVVDPLTGNSYTFTVTADVGATDTEITVDCATIDTDLSSGAYVVIDTDTYVDNIRNGTGVSLNAFREVFSVDGDSSVTVTANGGGLPLNTDYIDVLYNGQELTESDDYTVSSPNINFTFSATGSVQVYFYTFAVRSTATRYKQKFTGTAASSVTVTENSGNLPNSPAYLDVIYNGQTLTAGTDYTVSGAAINFTFSFFASDVIVVKFWGTESAEGMNRYKEKFTGSAGSSVTVTANSGTLPTSTAKIDVLYNGQELTETDDYAISGSDINFTFSFFADDVIVVKFWV